MNRNLSALALSAVIAFSIATESVAGISTNGSTVIKDQHNVWFLGDAPVEYCVEVADDFSADREAAKLIVREALDDWRRFFAKYQLDQMLFPMLRDGRSLGLSLVFIEIEKCQKPAEQVRFIFGSIDEDVKAALVLEEGAVALAARHEYDHRSYRNGGLIFLRDKGLAREEIKHLVLHELGHVFGMAHDSVHVMHERTAEMILQLKMPKSLLGQIESPTWPYRLEHGSVIDFTAAGMRVNGFEANTLLVYLGELFGFARAGTHSAQLVAKESRGARTIWEMSLVFAERETGKQVRMDGFFGIRPMVSDKVRGIQGPSLYTQWPCDFCGSSGVLSQRRYLDTRPSRLEADGYFKLDGLVLPASLEHRAGTLLKIFVPNRGWWRSDGYATSHHLL